MAQTPNARGYDYFFGVLGGYTTATHIQSYFVLLLRYCALTIGNKCQPVVVKDSSLLSQCCSVYIYAPMI